MATVLEHRPHPVKWLAPAPLWSEFVSDVPAFTRPDILEFSSDSFMDVFMNALAPKSSGLGGYRAKAENWRKQSMDQLKLYQPAHNRHYLVTASLVCQVRGLPDKAVDPGQQETASFVVRRLLPSSASATNGSSAYDEHAMVLGENGPQWVKVVDGGRTSTKVVVPGEELLPMFPVNYDAKPDRRRRLFAGTVPVGKREVYESSSLAPPAEEEAQDGTSETTGSAASTRKALETLFSLDVTEPWNGLKEAALAQLDAVSTDQFTDSDFDLPGHLDSASEQAAYIGEQISKVHESIQTGSWYILLDFAAYVDNYVDGGIEGPIRSVLEAITVKSDVETSLDHLTRNVEPNLYEALVSIEDYRTKLEEVTDAYDSSDSSSDWPDFLFPLADPSTSDGMALVRDGSLLSLAALKSDVFALLKEEPEKPVPDRPLAAQLSDVGRLEQGESLYLIRCVFQRPACRPFHPDVVSEPTRYFRLAGFFDPDAPARPIRITLPEDPTPAGLRKYAKNTAFMMSDVMCGQMAAMKKVTFVDLVLSVLPWPFHKDLPISASDMVPCPGGAGGQGRCCSLSIPIVTICAMFLLMMIVLILDYVFRWVPFLMTCFPLPNFKGKK